MSTGEILFDKANGRFLFKIGGTIVVSAKNNDWANGDSNGTSTDGVLNMTFDGTKSFWKFQYVHTGGTDEIFIDGQA
jgi:hypothetical protein